MQRDLARFRGRFPCVGHVPFALLVHPKVKPFSGQFFGRPLSAEVIVLGMERSKVVANEVEGIWTYIWVQLMHQLYALGASI